MTLAQLPQPDAREGRDRLEIMTALISAPSFDLVFRGDIIKIPAGHPVYRWNCLAADCERPVTGRGDLCGAHEATWREHRDGGGTRAGFLQSAPPVGPGEALEEQPCRICPDRPACHKSLQLCHYHQFRWYHYRVLHGHDADFGRWLAGQDPAPGYGRCRVRVCPETANSPLGLCYRHDRSYRRQGRPGGAVLPSAWGMRYEHRGLPVPVKYADEPAFRRWCASAPAVMRPGRSTCGACTRWHGPRSSGAWPGTPGASTGGGNCRCCSGWRTTAATRR